MTIQDSWQRIAGTTVCLVLLAAANCALAEGAGPQFELVDSSEVIARRGEVAVTQADVEHFLRDLDEQDRPTFLSSPQRVQQMLENLLLDRVVAADLLKQGYLDDPAAVAAARQAVIAHLVEVNKARIRTLPKDIDLDQIAYEHYQANRERYVEPEKLTFTQLLLRPDEDETPEQVRQQAFAIHQRILNGEEFDALILEHSEEPRVEEHGGRFEDVAPDQLVPAFVQEIAKMDTPGTISEPFSTRYGWHIVRFEGRVAARQQTFDEVREQILPTVRANLMQQQYRRHVNRLLDQAPAELDQEALDRLMGRYSVGTDD